MVGVPVELADEELVGLVEGVTESLCNVEEGGWKGFFWAS